MPVFRTGDKGKDRLYLTIQHRWNGPDYHLGIMYALKDEPGTTNEAETDTLFHVINSDSKTRQPIPWTFQVRSVNQYRSETLFARVLLRKIDPSRRRQALAALSSVLAKVPVQRNHSNFNCATWTINAVGMLQQYGIIALTMPADRLVDTVKRFAETSVKSINSGKVDIAALGASAIPILDLRSEDQRSVVAF